MSYNKSILLGRLTQDPELKSTPQGLSVATFSIAVDRPYSKEDKKTDFIKIIAWRQTAEFISKYFYKGNQILIDGSIQTRDYTDKNGNKRYVTEILAEKVSFVDSKSNSQQTNVNKNVDNNTNLDFEIVDTDDIPF